MKSLLCIFWSLNAISFVHGILQYVHVETCMYCMYNLCIKANFTNLLTGRLREVLCNKTTSLLRPIGIVRRVVLLSRFHCISEYPSCLPQLTSKPICQICSRLDQGECCLKAKGHTLRKEFDEFQQKAEAAPKKNKAPYRKSQRQLRSSPPITATAKQW